jgi:hypothetical protein
MSDHMNLFVPEFLAQGFEVFDQVVEAVRGWGYRAFAMTPQIVTDAGKVLLQAVNKFVPGGLAGTDTMHHVQGRTLSFDTIADIDSGHLPAPLKRVV